MIEIDQALINTFISSDFGLPISHENFDFDPGGLAYAQIDVMQNDITGLGLTETNQTDGLFQVILRYPVNSGSIAIKTKADTILAVYKIGATLTYNSVNVKIKSNKRFNGIHEDGWHKIIISIGYLAFLSR